MNCSHHHFTWSQNNGTKKTFFWFSSLKQSILRLQSDDNNFGWKVRLDNYRKCQNILIFFHVSSVFSSLDDDLIAGLKWVNTKQILPRHNLRTQTMIWSSFKLKQKKISRKIESMPFSSKQNTNQVTDVNELRSRLPSQLDLQIHVQQKKTLLYECCSMMQIYFSVIFFLSYFWGSLCHPHTVSQMCKKNHSILNTIFLALEKNL